MKRSRSLNPRLTEITRYNGAPDRKSMKPEIPRLRRAALHWSLAVAIGMLVFGLVPPASAGPIPGTVNTGSISGIVKSNAPGPPMTLVPDAHVELQGGGSSLNVNTNRDGQYSFSNLRPGAYTLTVSRLGFQTWSRQITIGDGDFVQDVVLGSQISINADALAITPGEASPGDTVTVTYTLTNNNSDRTIPVTLGAVLSDSDAGGNTVGDESNEITVSVPPGTGQYSRPFVLPSDMNEGDYDFHQRVWGNPVRVFAPMFDGMKVKTRVLTVTKPLMTFGDMVKTSLIMILLISIWVMYRYRPKFLELCRRQWIALAERRILCIILVGCLAIGIRLSLLPWFPVPSPHVRDEYGHLFVGETLASGRLSNPTHPLWQHFETIYIFHQPSYAAMYPLGQGLFLALGNLLTGVPWFGVLISVGLMCGAICWMLQGWLPPVWALLGGCVAIDQFVLLHRIDIYGWSYWTNSYWGGAVSAFAGALIFGALPRLFRRPRVGISVILGSGWGLLWLTRPFESLVLGLILAVGLAGWLLLFSSCGWRVKASTIVLPLAAVIALAIGASGFYNWRVTGDPFLMPYRLHQKIYGVPQAFFWQRPIPEPPLRYENLRMMYQWTRSGYDQSQSAGYLANSMVGRLAGLWSFYFGWAFTIPLVLSLFALKELSVKLLAGTAALGFLGSIVFPFYSPHYSAPYTAVFMLFIVLGLRVLWRTHARSVPVGLLCMAGLLGASVLPAIGHVARTMLEGPASKHPRAQIEAKLLALKGRHLVFVHYGPGHDLHNEWAYNSPDIDKAAVVWARELNPESDAALIRYFNDRQVWSVDPDASSASIRLQPLSGK